MENTVTNNKVCPTCHVIVRTNDYFCFNCGLELAKEMTPVGTINMIGVLIGSVFLPPMGIVWGLRYLKKASQKTKIVGMGAIILTIISLVWSTIYVIEVLNTVNRQVNERMENLQAL